MKSAPQLRDWSPDCVCDPMRRAVYRSAHRERSHHRERPAMVDRWARNRGLGWRMIFVETTCCDCEAIVKECLDRPKTKMPVC